MKILLFFFFCINLFSLENEELFIKNKMTNQYSDKIIEFLDSIKVLNAYQIKINDSAFNKDSMLVLINDTAKLNFILQDTIIEKFDMLCLSYLVKETKSKVILYSFENFKRISLTFFNEGIYYKIENVGDDHIFYSFKNSENLNSCGNENVRITNKYSKEKSVKKKNLLSSGYEECFIRICIGYLPSATSYLSKINLRNRILEEINNTNQAYINSEVDLEVEISRTKYVDDYLESDQSVNTVCKDFTSNQSLGIHTTKENYFSDMLAILIHRNSGDYGYGFFGGRPDFNYDSVISATRLLAPNQYSFTHELAHNQGCFHNYNINNNLTPPFIYRENPYFDYGHGFYDASIKKYSIVKQNPSNDSERILYFSNPDITIDGKNFGEDGNMDNARVLRETKDWMISYKTIPIDYILSNIYPNGEKISEAEIADISAFETIDLNENFETEIHSITTIKTGDEIRIGPGFHAKAGSNVHAYIKDQNCNPSTKKSFNRYEMRENFNNNLTLSPNPTSESTIARVEIGEKSICSLTLLDNLGNEVITIFKDKELEPGNYQYDIEASNLSSGVYLCVLRIGNSLHSEKLVYLK